MQGAMKILRIMVLILGTHVLIFAQTDNSPVDSLFSNAVSYYTAGRYGQALQKLENLDRLYPGHSRLTASLLMQGKSLYKLKEYTKALNVFKKMASEHPGSQYRDDVHYGLGTVYYQVQMYPQSVQNLLKVVEESQDKELQKKAAKLSSEIMDYRMNTVELQTLLEEVASEREKAAVILRLAQREIDDQHYQNARKVLLEFKRNYPKSSFLPKMDSLLERTRVTNPVVKIGVILPLSGPLEEQGKNFLDGLEYAARIANQQIPRIQLIVRDSESRMITAILAAQELVRNEEIIALIGELESDISAAIAAVAKEWKCPLLVPVATEDGITDIGPFVFQLNGNLDNRSKLLADYAVNALGLKRFATLYPADRYGKSMNDGFKKYVEEKGGKILIEKWYFEGTEDLRPQFDKIREFGIEQMIKDTLIVIVPKERLPRYYTHTNRLYTDMTVKELVDSTELAVTAFDGLFMPIYSEDLPFLIPQLATANLNARVFGGVTWDDPEVLVENQKYIDERYRNGVVFLSDFYIDPSDYRFFQMRDTFREAVGKTPEKMEVFGFDTANFLISSLGSISTREEMGEALASKRQYEAMRNRMDFNEKRVNTSIRLLQFIGGRILLGK